MSCPLSARSLAPLLTCVLMCAVACDDQAAPAKAETKSAPAQQLDEAKAEIKAAEQALQERGDHIAEQSNAQ